MFLVQISNPENEKECMYYTITDTHPKGDLLREAMWAVGRKYGISFYPTHIYIGMEKIAKEAPKVTTGELLKIYSKIKFYKEVVIKVAEKKLIQVSKTCMFKPHFAILESKCADRVFFRFATYSIFTSVNEELFMAHLNEELGTSFKKGNGCWHHQLSEIDEEISVNSEQGYIFRDYKEIVTVYKHKIEKVLI